VLNEALAGEQQDAEIEGASNPVALEVNTFAAHLPARVFLMSQNGTGMEMLHPQSYVDYVETYRGKQGVTDTMDELPGTNITLHRFVKELEEVQCTVQPMSVSEGALVGMPGEAHAFSALRLPCNSYTRPTAGLLLPRIAAPTQPRTIPEVKPMVLLVKEFLIHNTSDETAKRCSEVHTQCLQQSTQPYPPAANDAAVKVCLPRICRSMSLRAIYHDLQYITACKCTWVAA
jgi:hypothetical protein